MGFVKVYNGTHQEDLNMKCQWNTNFRAKVGCQGYTSREYLEQYLQKAGENITQQVGVKINPKSVTFCYREGDSEAEFEARIACDKLLKKVQKTWTHDGQVVDVGLACSRPLI